MKFTTFILFLFLWMMIVQNDAMAQPINNEFGDVTMPSAEATSLGKFGDIPVGHFTGVPSISIPISEIVQGPLKLPVSINYHASGVKIAELASNVGLGWSLSAGGMISRTVMGAPDERSYGWFNLENLEEGRKESLNNSTVDLEPDLFQLSLPNYSVKFLFPMNLNNLESKEAILIPHKDLKIEIIVTQFDILGFKVYLPDGTICFFGYKEGESVIEESSGSGRGDYVKSGWYLVRMESSDKEHSIDLNYESKSYWYHYPSTVVRYNVADEYDCEEYFSDNLPLRSYIKSKYIKSIVPSAGNSSIEFIYGDISEMRQDLESNFGITPSPLNKIHVKQGNFNKVFNFDYNYFVSPEDGYDVIKNSSYKSHYKRLRLESIQESNIDNSILLEPYRFEYFGSESSLPHRLTKSIDHWGFYNGEIGNNNNVLNIPRSKSGIVELGNSNRESNGNYMKNGSLNKIIYPTGGYSLFDLETNKVLEISDDLENYIIKEQINHQYDSNNVGSCFRVEKDTSNIFTLSEKEIHEADIVVDLIRLNDGNCEITPRSLILKLFSINNSVPLAEFSLRQDPRDDEDTPDEPPIRMNFEEMFGEISSGSYFLVMENVRSDGIATLYVKSVESIIRNKEVGGLRVKSIRHYTSAGVESASIYYDYTEDGSDKSSGKLYKMPEYGINDYILKEHYDDNQNFVLTNYYFSDGSITPLSDFDGYHIGYNRVVERKNGNGSTEYLYNSVKHISLSTFPQIPDPIKVENGHLLKKSEFDDSGNLLKYDRYIITSIYKSFSIPAIRVLYFNFEFLDPCKSRYSNTFYIRSGHYNITKEIHYAEGLTTTTDYKYRTDTAHLLPIEEKTIHADGTVVKMVTQYAHDIGQNDLIERNMINIPLERNMYVGNNQVSGSKTLYKLFSNFPRPEKLQSYNWLTSNWETETSIFSYDNFGNPTEIQQRGWEKEYFDWDNDLLKERRYIDFVWKYDYYPNSRLLQKYTEPTGLYTTYAYDGLIRLDIINQYQGKSITDVDYFYSQNGQPNKIVTSLTYSDGTSLNTEQEYDGLGRPTLLRKKGYGSGSQDVVSKVEYDDVGRLWKEYQPGFGSPGSPTIYTYEASPLNRISAIEAPDPIGPITMTYGSEGGMWIETKTDAEGKISKSYTDTRGRQRYMEVGSSPELAKTEYIYNDKNELKTVLPPGISAGDADYIYEYTYDGRGNVLSRKVPERQVSEYRYDDRDIVTHSKDGIHPIIYTEHDDYGQPEQSGFVTGFASTSISSANLLSSMVYNYTPSSLGFGQLKESKTALLDETGSPSGQYISSISKSWDNYHRLKRTESNHVLDIDNLTALISDMTWTALDQLDNNSITVNVGLESNQYTEKYSYDHSGRLTSQDLTFDGEEKELFHILSYNPWDQIVTKTLGGNLQTVNYSYLANGFLDKINNGSVTGDLSNTGVVQPTENSAGDLFALDLDYTRIGNIEAMKYQNRGYVRETMEYDYDGLNRLKTAGASSGNYSYQYIYRDLLGNIDQIHRTDLVYGEGSWQPTMIDDLTMNYSNNKTSRLTSVDDASNHEGGYEERGGEYGYDGNGNRNYDPQYGTTTTYNHLNLPSRVEKEDGSYMVNIYDALGKKWQQINHSLSEKNQKRSYIGSMEYVGEDLDVLHHSEGLIRNINAGSSGVEVLNGPARDSERSRFIVTTEDVLAGQQIDYRASRSISLEPGFHGRADGVIHGFIDSIPSEPRYQWQYKLVDHLNNTRVLFTDKNGDGLIRQSTDSTVNEVLSVYSYSPFGLEQGGSYQGRSRNDYRYSFSSKEGIDFTGYRDFGARNYDGSVGRFVGVDPLADHPNQVDKSPYAAMWNNPIRYNDPDGRCPNCITGLIGGAIGGLVGGGIELGRQLYNNGSVTNWSAVGGSASQGAITGASAGFTGGASLVATAGAAGAANVVGGTVNRSIQGQETTLGDVAVDATIGAGLGAAGNAVGGVVKGAVDDLSNATKGKLGEALTTVKYGAQGYKSTGKAIVATGGKTATGRVQVAKYDHAMQQVGTGKQLTVESKFNTSGLTPHQRAAAGNVQTPGGLIIHRTTSQGVGNAAGAATTGAGAGAAAQKEIEY